MEPSESSIIGSPDLGLSAEAPPLVHTSKADQVNELLAGAVDPPADESAEAPETGAEDQPAAETPADLAALAARLGVDVAKLYETQVPIDGADGPVTLGQLKDAFKSAQALEAEQSRVTKARAEWQADQLRTQREVDLLLAALDPKAVKPELVRAVQQQQAERLSREQEALLRTVPEWSDPRTVQTDIATMQAHLQPYGLTAADLDQVLDHRWLRYVRDQARIGEKLTAKPAPPPVKPAQGPRRGPRGDTPALEYGRLQQAVQTKSIRPVDAVAQLLKGR